MVKKQTREIINEFSCLREQRRKPKARKIEREPRFFPKRKENFDVEESEKMKEKEQNLEHCSKLSRCLYLL